jgi:ubiquinone/menaquinone biosynthesis C-methylase UbiE
MNCKEHWEKVYRENSADDVSWFQKHPEVSLQLIAATGVRKQEGIIDVGGGASVLVDCLLDEGFERLAVLDISGAALVCARQRLGARAGNILWLEADVTTFAPAQRFAVWHDRAVFHFLTEAEDRSAYFRTLERTLTPGGHVIIATFAEDGPLKCSGLEIARYDAAGIRAEIGPGFEFRSQINEAHATPWQTEQKFSYFVFQRKA